MTLDFLALPRGKRVDLAVEFVREHQCPHRTAAEIYHCSHTAIGHRLNHSLPSEEEKQQAQQKLSPTEERSWSNGAINTTNGGFP